MEQITRARVALVASLALVLLVGAVPGAQRQGGDRPAKGPAVYRVATFDSGFGGYFTAKEIEKQAKALAEDGYGPITIAHYGDTTNVPYGEKTPDQVARFASAGILAAFHDGASDVYIACNTASTQFDRIREILRTQDPSYPNRVYSIIDVSVREVMKTVSAKLKTSDVVTVGIMATPAAVKSEAYPRFLAAALNVPFSHGAFTKFTQPRWLITAGPSIDSYAYRAELALGPKKKVIVYQMAPANWVDMIERGAPDAEKLDAVTGDLALLSGQMKAVERFDVVGEFCTHYPVFDAMIQTELRRKGKVRPDTPFIVQGPLMGQLFRTQYLQRKPAKSPTPVPPPLTPPFYLTGTNVEPTRQLIKKVFPHDPVPLIEHKVFVIPK